MLIERNNLNEDAVVPQCLDNQYLSDEVFQKMLKSKVDFYDKGIAELREKDFRTEFNRSLIYSSQTVVQRAYLKNNHFLHNMFLPHDRKNFNAFADLIRSKAIVPFLFRERTLSEGHKFDLSDQGDLAVKALLGELGDVTCVRLAVDDIVNLRETDAMSANFGAGIARVMFLTDAQRNAMAIELFRNGNAPHTAEGWDAFNTALDDMAAYVHRKQGELRKTNGQVQRQHLYEDMLVVPGKDNVVSGRFRRPNRDTPFLFEIKKFVDLVYNTNLPDCLGRHTFTPRKLPSRLALQDLPGKGFSHEEISQIVSQEEAFDAIRRRFMAESQQAMSLPLLSDLTMADVHEIRQMPEWAKFTQAQIGVLQHPEDCLARLEGFHADFNALQNAISKWYGLKYRHAKTVERYRGFVSLALSLGGKLLVAGSHFGAVEKGLMTFASDKVVSHIPEKISGYAAKLMVGVYDVGTKQLDTDRTYTIELMQTSAEILKDDVIALLQSISAKEEGALPSAGAQVADQGVR